MPPFNHFHLGGLKGCANCNEGNFRGVNAALAIPEHITGTIGLESNLASGIFSLVCLECSEDKKTKNTRFIST